MFNIPKYFGFRGRALNLAISSLGSFDFLYVAHLVLISIPLVANLPLLGFLDMTKV